jgi:putative FmdB family regulatory protein
MPTYTYKCSTDYCQYEFEVIQKITEDPITICPNCDGKTKRVIKNGNFVLKGEKWYSKGGNY